MRRNGRADSRVRQDARRTFAKSDDFTTRVPTDKIIRLLNAYVVCRAAAPASGYVRRVSALKDAELRRKATGSAQDFSSRTSRLTVVTWMQDMLTKIVTQSEN